MIFSFLVKTCLKLEVSTFVVHEILGKISSEFSKGKSLSEISKTKAINLK